MRATVERYLAARRLTDRPMTVRRTEEGLSRFVAWLVARRPECGSFAAVTRDMVLDFMATTNDDCHPRTGRPLSPLTRPRAAPGGGRLLPGRSGVGVGRNADTTADDARHPGPALFALRIASRSHDGQRPSNHR